jgi:hypothetical protein
MRLCCYVAKRPNLKLKNQPKQLLGSLALALALFSWVRTTFSITTLSITAKSGPVGCHNLAHYNVLSVFMLRVIRLSVVRH